MTVNDGVEFDCPFCEKACVASAEQTMVAHAMPYCPQFMDLPVEDFIHAVNEKLDPSPVN